MSNVSERMAIRLVATVLPLLAHLPRNEWIPGVVMNVGGRWYFVPEAPALRLARIQLATLKQLWHDCDVDIARTMPWETTCIDTFEELTPQTERPA